MKYSLAEAAKVLGISDRQLRRWLERYRGNVEYDETDQRRRLLGEQQVRWLAEKHGKTPPNTKEIPRSREADVVALEGQIQRLTRIARRLEQDITDLNVALSSLRAQVENAGEKSESAMDKISERLTMVESTLVETHLMLPGGRPIAPLPLPLRKED